MTKSTPATQTQQVWFLTGSQELYGPQTLAQVAEQSQSIAAELAARGHLHAELVWKPVLTNASAIRACLDDANREPACIGVIAWMHTFSPAKMWISGLDLLRKPLLHLHTQVNQSLPWATIDMDFMNLNQAAHGDREAGFIHTRMRLGRKVVVGHWSDGEVQDRIGAWMRATRAWHDAQGAKFARFGDNMRQVAVTDGDKVAAEMRLGYAVNGYGIGDLVKHVDGVSDAAITKLCAE